VDDVAEAMVLAALYDGPEAVLNVGSGVGRSVHEVADSICAILGRPGTEFTYKQARRADVAANVLDVTRIGAALGWSAQTGWEEGVLLTAEWIKRAFRT